MARIITAEECKKQETAAKWLFWVLLVLLLGFIFLVMMFQFGWFGITAAKGVLFPPAVTDAAAGSGAGNAEEGVTAASVGSTYLVWLFASWAGISIYLLSTAANRYRKIPDDPDTDFIRYVFWYIMNFVRAPLLAMIILWILTNININLGPDGSPGAVADFSKLPPIVLIGIAFILGMYARVSQKQMDIITKAIFPKAWVMAEESFEVVGPDTLLLRDQYTFRTDPASEVTWTASPGEIDPNTGVYKAPPSESDADKLVIIRASMRSDPSKTNHKAVTLKLIQINGPAKMETPSAILSIDTKLSDTFTEAVLKDVNWESGEGTFNPAIGVSTTFTVKLPTDKTVKPVETARIKAKLTYKGQTYMAEKSISVKTADQ
jgi:hypothetical protein